MAGSAIPIIRAAIRRLPFFWGWHDPFWCFGGYDVDSYTLYTSFLDLDIRRKADDQSLFEGHAQARSQTNELPRLVPNLVEAMFTGFPGQHRRNRPHHGDARRQRRARRATAFPAGQEKGPRRPAAFLSSQSDRRRPQLSSWRVSRRMSASSSASWARSFSICLTAWITVV